MIYQLCIQNSYRTSQYIVFIYVYLTYRVQILNSSLSLCFDVM